PTTLKAVAVAERFARGEATSRDLKRELRHAQVAAWAATHQGKQVGLALARCATAVTDESGASGAWVNATHRRASEQTEGAVGIPAPLPPVDQVSQHGARAHAAQPFRLGHRPLSPRNSTSFAPCP